MTDAVVWTERDGVYSATAHGCTLRVETAWPSTLLWYVTFGEAVAARHGRVSRRYYATPDEARERAQSEAVAAARSLSERSGLAAALARVAQLEAALGGVAMDLHTLLTRPVPAATTERVLRAALERTRRVVLDGPREGGGGDGC